MASPAGLQASPAPSRRERRVREVHDRILEAAMQRFEQRGIDATKIDEICATADVAQKTFFNHFPTKHHLVREIAASFLRDLLAILDEARRGPGTTAQKLERFFTRIAAENERAGPMHRDLVIEVIGLIHHERSEAENTLQLYAAFGALLRDGVRAADVTRAYPVAVLSEIVAGAFSTLMLNWIGIEDYPIRARAAAMARFLADALRVRGRDVIVAKPKRVR
jgi:AcrR family transcriptional regulator